MVKQNEKRLHNQEEEQEGKEQEEEKCTVVQQRTNIHHHTQTRSRSFCFGVCCIFLVFFFVSFVFLFFLRVV